MATRVKDYRNRFTIYKSDDPNDPHPFFAEGKNAPSKAVPATGATLEEIEKKLDEYK